MVWPRAVAFQEGGHIAQAPGAGDLCQQHGEQQLLGGQPAPALVGAVPLDQAVERGVRQAVGELVEHSIMVRHGAGPVHVRFVGERFEPSRINGVPLVQQEYTGQP